MSMKTDDDLERRWYSMTILRVDSPSDKRP